MTEKQKKVVTALRRYYQYLSARFNYISLGILEVSDREYNRMITSRKFFYKYFASNRGFRDWLLKDPHDRRHKANMDLDNEFYNIAENLKNEILRSEK